MHRLAESISRLLKNLKIPSLAGRYDNPVPIRFPAPIDCSEIPAQDSYTKFKKRSGFHVRITDMNLFLQHVYDALLNNLTRYCKKLSFSMLSLLQRKANENKVVGERGNKTGELSMTIHLHDVSIF